MCVCGFEQVRALDREPEPRGSASLVRQGFSSAPYIASSVYPSSRMPGHCSYLDRWLVGRCWRPGSSLLRRSEWPRKSFPRLHPTVGLETWRGDVAEHLICQIELFAVLGVRMHLRQEFRQRRVIFWIDNESARLCLVRGYSKSRSMDCLMRAYAQLEDKEPCFAWYARVPSHSNIADAPSRFEGKQVLGLAGAKAVETFPVIPNLRTVFFAQHIEWGDTGAV